jgi:hypothetical protein
MGEGEGNGVALIALYDYLIAWPGYRHPGLMPVGFCCHCEERSDEAISIGVRTRREIALLRSQ